MTTRVFRARTLLDARQAATEALGHDAVVLTTREVKRPGLFGLLGGTEIEIAAATIPKAATSSPGAANRGPFAAEAYATPDVRPLRAREPSRATTMNALRSDLRTEIRAVKMALGRPMTASASQDPSDLGAEVAAIREALELLAPPAARGDKLATLLRARGIEGRAASALSRAVKAQADGTLEDRVRGALEGMLRVGPLPMPSKGTRALIAAVGPSGVGKTTTLAKLATLAKSQGLKVELVTCDTFRVGGVEHLRRYASLLDVPFNAARSEGDLEALLGKSEADVFIVDTSGRPPTTGAPELLLSEKKFINMPTSAKFERHVVLCMTAATREVDALRTVRTFSQLAPTALGMTKLDETSVPSGILHAAWSARLPIALTCAGQRVPEDIQQADMSSLLQQLVPSPDSRKARAA